MAWRRDAARILVMTDIEGVTGVTTFSQAENSEFGRRMLMSDLQKEISGADAAMPWPIIRLQSSPTGHPVRPGE